MKIDNKSKLIIPIVAALLIGIVSRIVPHVPNFTPIGAMAIFTGVLFRNKLGALALVLGTLFVSDLLLNNLVYAEYYEGFTLFTGGAFWIYGGFAAMIFIAPLLIKKLKAMPIVITSLLGSVLFFVLSNFGVFLASTMYSKDLSGLIATYTAAIPFFGGTMAGDLFFCAVMFGAYAMVSKKSLKAVELKA